MKSRYKIIRATATDLDVGGVGEELGAEVPPEDVASAVVPDALGFDGEAFVDTVLPSGNWGAFRFTFRKGTCGRPGAYSVKCRWHKLSDKTDCKKQLNIEGFEQHDRQNIFPNEDKHTQNLNNCSTK